MHLMTGPLDRLRAAAAEREAAGLRRVLRPRTPGHDGLLDLASNDYLGLSRDERLVEAAVRATREWGVGSTGSRLVTGSTRLHAELEDRLAAFTGAAGALVFSSGYLANLAAVAALGQGGLIVSDMRQPRLDRGRLPAVAVAGRGDAARGRGGGGQGPGRACRRTRPGRHRRRLLRRRRPRAAARPARGRRTARRAAGGGRGPRARRGGRPRQGRRARGGPRSAARTL